jgi:uncharacterized protein YndB with AHSA1/START domain
MDHPDRIDKEVVLRAPRSRVWKAISDSSEFGAWFRIRFDVPFAAGKASWGQLLDNPKYEHVRIEFLLEQIEPERLLSFRWHPAAIEEGVDYSKEPKTLVVFTLEDVAGGTKLHVSESGFHALPPERRAKAFPMNEGGWAEQVRRVERYVAKDS